MKKRYAVISDIHGNIVELNKGKKITNISIADPTFYSFKIYEEK